MARPQADSDVFRAIADETRRGVLELLRSGEKPVSDLVREFDISPPSMTHHLRVLVGAGLITQKRVGRQRLCRLEAKGLREVARWAGSFEKHWKRRRRA